MATKKKKPTAEKAVVEAPPEKPPEPKASIEVDWGRGFVAHFDAVVSGSSIKVPVPLRVRHALGQAQTKGRYDRIRVKRDGQELRIGRRTYYKDHSDAQPSLTFEIVE